MSSPHSIELKNLATPINSKYLLELILDNQAHHLHVRISASMSTLPTS